MSASPKMIVINGGNTETHRGTHPSLESKVAYNPPNLSTENSVVGLNCKILLFFLRLRFTKLVS